LSIKIEKYFIPRRKGDMENPRGGLREIILKSKAIN